MKESLELKEVFNVSASELYHAWLDSELHTQMTGGEAECSNQTGASFSAWDGYITGKNMVLIEGEKIVQTWRTSEFDENDEDSILTVLLSEQPKGCELVLLHTNIPSGQTQYEQGWGDHYFEPMKEFFG
jgi:activator of HSP90 ATPase